MSQNSFIPTAEDAHRADFRDEMRAFDRLPKCLREAIAGAAFQISAVSVLRNSKAAKAAGVSAKERAAHLRARDADLVARETQKIHQVKP